MRLKENLAEFPSEDVDVATPWDELKDVAFAGEDEVAEEAGFRLDNPEFKCYYLSEVKAEKRNSEGEVLAEYSF